MKVETERGREREGGEREGERGRERERELGEKERRIRRQRGNEKRRKGLFFVKRGLGVRGSPSFFLKSQSSLPFKGSRDVG